MSGGVESNRKRRSDRKRDISPTVTHELHECIRRLAYITDTPIKDVAEAVCINGITSTKVIEYMSQYFMRNVRIGATLYRRNPNTRPIQRRYLPGQTARVAIRFKSETHATISALAYAMDCTVSRACAVLLDASIRDGEFIDEFVKAYLSRHIDEDRMRELKRLLKYINANNPYEETYTWAALLSLMVEEVRESVGNVADSVSDFIVKNWRDK